MSFKLDFTPSEAIAYALRKRLKFEGEFSLDTEITSVIGDNPYLLSHLLLDMHEALEEPYILYPLNEESSLFITFQDIVTYFEKNIANR